MLRGIVVRGNEASQDRTRPHLARVESIDESLLDVGLPVASTEASADVMDLDVLYSSVNFKDALALSGRPGIIRRPPRIPGIDVVGVVARTNSPRFTIGDLVTLNGAGLGERYNGGFATRARVPASSAIVVPHAFSAQQAAAIGTAGLTAMLAVQALADHGVPSGDGEILVTGATGGVGSLAIAILARRGYRVTAVTGRVVEHGDYLRALGAVAVIDRAPFAKPGKPLQSAQWDGVIDVLGSDTLVNALAQVRWGGVVATCGLAQGADLPATVMPFILRGVTLTGVNSVDAPLAHRQRAWDDLATDLDLAILESLTTSVSLDATFIVAEQMMAGQSLGRTVVDLRA